MERDRDWHRQLIVKALNFADRRRPGDLARLTQYRCVHKRFTPPFNHLTDTLLSCLESHERVHLHANLRICDGTPLRDGCSSCENLRYACVATVYHPSAEAHGMEGTMEDVCRADHSAEESVDAIEGAPRSVIASIMDRFGARRQRCCSSRDWCKRSGMVM
jgi:hypothetical protein